MWKRIPKEVSIQPKEGIYSDWKPMLSVEGFHQCVYCFVSEVHFGGIRNFHVEHYRPKKKFKELTNVYRNLFYVCPICNGFKSEDWPNEPNDNFDLPFYPDPSIIGYNELFEIEEETYSVKGKNITSSFLVNRLFLNRKQLINFRRKNGVEIKYSNEIKRIRNSKNIFFKIIVDADDKLVKEECMRYLNKIEDIVNNLQDNFRMKDYIVPYTREDTVRK